MAMTNAERQAKYRRWKKEVGSCATGGCQQIAHPHRKCGICRRKEADQKAAKRRETIAELREVALLRSQVQELEDQVAKLEEQNASLVQRLSAVNKYNILASDFEHLAESFKDEYDE